MGNTANDEVQAILKHASKELSNRGYAFVAFAAHLPVDGSPTVFASRGGSELMSIQANQVLG